MRVSLSLLANGSVGVLDAEARELLDIAYRHCERLVRLVNDMLDVQKIEAGGLGLNRTRHALLPLAQEAAAAMHGLGRDRGITIDVTGDVGAGIAADIDHDRLLQVLTNLLSNAIKFSPANAAVRLVVARFDGGARIAVADRGSGIPATFRERIFQRFAHAGSAGGSGLGLSISKGIVDEHGGQLWFESVEGEGTTFYVDLPA